MAFKIQLDLSRHCIESEIRRVHNRAVSAYFRADGKREHLEQTIAVTRTALESMDFPALRTRHTPLAGNTNRRVVLVLDRGEAIVYLDRQPIVRTGQQTKSAESIRD